MKEALEDLLKKNGYSLTRSRRSVFDLLSGHEPQSMQVLDSRAKGMMNRATLYRTISLFEELGVVHRLNIGFKYKLELTDSFSTHHHHLHCTNCGRIEVLPHDELLEKRIDKLAHSSGSRPSGHQLEIYGRCQNCPTHP